MSKHREELKLAWDLIAKIQRDLIQGEPVDNVLKEITAAALQKARRDRLQDFID